MRTVRYYLVSFLSFFISFIGIIGVKLSIIVVAIGVSSLTEQYTGKLGLSLGWIIGLFVGGLLFIGLQRLVPYLDRLDDYTKTLKKYPYTEKYGKDYPQPESEDFGITQAEFEDYNKRFQFEYIKMIFTFCPWLSGSIYVIVKEIKGFSGILIMGGGAMVAIIFNYLFDYWNKKISQRHRYYEKIQKYQEANKIYYKIRDEKSNN